MDKQGKKISLSMEDISAGITKFFKKFIASVKSDGLKGILNIIREYTGGNVPVEPKRFCEINLVPDIKSEMLKAQKIRNLTLFALIIVCGASAGLITITGIYTAAQGAIIGAQGQNIKNLDGKIKSFSSLNDFLTVQGQLNKISELNEQKRSLSRIFSILSVLLAQSPDGAGNKDRISISEMVVNMDSSSIVFEASAQALKEPKIDYRVLEAFKKSSQVTNYDHGRYVTASGKKIPARCVEDTNENGDILAENDGVYGLWYKEEKGCDPDRADGETTIEGEKPEVSQNPEGSKSVAIIDNFLKKPEQEKKPEQTSQSNAPQNQETTVSKPTKENNDKTHRYSSKPEKIWRTPQFSTWASEKKMDNNGHISGIPHFESACIKYEKVGGEDSSKWQASNQCNLMSKPLEVIQSSNARNANGNLVLRFSAKLSLNPEVFLFKNKHVIAIAPSGRNVTDSYTQVNNMFDARAIDCKPNDPACKDTKNSGKDNK